MKKSSVSKYSTQNADIFDNSNKTSFVFRHDIYFWTFFKSLFQLSHHFKGLIGVSSF